MKKEIRVIISGGGTGGHIFPAIAIANSLRARFPECKILFVGAEGRMEMEKVPAAGYEIIGLPVQGFDRKNLLKNIPVLFNLIRSLRKSKKIIRDFSPDIAVGVGGYASGPLMEAAAKKRIPIVIQEQNSYPGVTNKLLASKASVICVAYDNMDRYFPQEKIVLTGNPVRQNLIAKDQDKSSAYASFDLEPSKKTVLIIGGSLGAGTINQSVLANLDKMVKDNIQFIWQTGKYYYEDALKAIQSYSPRNLHVTAFINRMDQAYLIADLVISRAGASSISELCLLGKPAILVPSPNVAEDHQTKNAMALVSKNAAILVRDPEAQEKLIDKALEVVTSPNVLLELHDNILKLGIKHSDKRIVDEIEKLLLAE